ncbi:MAG: xanthine phosphoribosyltransferase [Clostridiales Family XIII bacterium]|jgi:xanthine phosphoribosyltransferase|nr:xanthine phosphoribosyltransferase [Clostridiales Family XIII bacterium]
MDVLKQRIVRDGVALGTEILKVDSFLNHRIDVGLLAEIGAEFRRRFSDVAGEVDKILTVEASGIAVAAFAARSFDDVPVVFAKKAQPSTMDDEYFFSEIMSFTKRQMTAIRIAKKFLAAGDRCLVIDDFLAHGQAALGLLHIARQAGAEVLGAGFVIEKGFQGGGAKLREKGVRVESLAVVREIKDGQITFE